MPALKKGIFCTVMGLICKIVNNVFFLALLLPFMLAMSACRPKPVVSKSLYNDLYDSIYVVGQDSLLAGSFGPAKQIFEQTILKSRKEKNWMYEGIGYLNMGALYSYSGKMDSATIMSVKGLKVFELHHYEGPEYLTLRLNMLASKEESGNYEENASEALELLEKTKKIKDTGLMLTALNSLANTFVNLNENTKALQYYKEAAAIGSLSSDPSGVPTVLSNIAGIYNKIKQYREGLAVCRQALDLQHINVSARINIYLNLSRLHLSLMNFDSALHYAGWANDSNRVYFNDPAIDVSTLTCFVNIYHAQNDFGKALQMVDSGLNMIAAKTNPETIAELQHERSLLLEMTGEYRDALEAIGIADSIKAAIQTNEAKAQVADLEIRYKTKEKEEYIKYLSLNARMQKQKIMVVSVALITALLFSAIALFQFRKQQNANRIISAQSGKLEIMMQEIHHRVRNNLQVITALINMQEQQIEHPELGRFLRDTKTRINAISLIHQKLYQNAAPDQIVLQEYIEQLSSSLLDLYGFAQINIDAQELVMDIDTAVPLGLIITELITNSCKYARVADQTLNIQISFQQEKNQYRLIYKDNGPGLPDHISPHATSQSLGMKMIRLMVTQIGGELRCTNKEGILFNIKFKNTQQRKQTA